MLTNPQLWAQMHVLPQEFIYASALPVLSNTTAALTFQLKLLELTLMDGNAVGQCRYSIYLKNNFSGSNFI
jgi:hypothetical protein